MQLGGKCRSVSQHAGETIDTFYHKILKICDQCEFSNPEENLIDSVMYGTNNNKAQEKLLQVPVTLTPQQTLTVCRHFESLKLHIEQIRPTKSVDYLQKRQQKSKKKSDQADQGQSKGKQSFQPKANPNLNRGQQNKCPRCGCNFHYGGERCPASNAECHFCHKTGYFSNLCNKHH